MYHVRTTNSMVPYPPNENIPSRIPDVETARADCAPTFGARARISLAGSMDFTQNLKRLGWMCTIKTA